MNGLTVRRGVAWLAAVGALAMCGATRGEDALPEGPVAELGRLYYSALSLPGLAGWDEAERTAFVDLVTLRYQARVVDRAAVPPERASAYVARLGTSDLGRDHPHVLRRVCAQFGLLDGGCRPHRGYVRRVLVAVEMLFQGQLTLSALEEELLGAARPALSAAMAGR